MCQKLRTEPASMIAIVDDDKIDGVIQTYGETNGLSIEHQDRAVVLFQILRYVLID